MGGIDIEQVAEEHPDHVGRGHFSNLKPISDFQAKQVIAAAGVTGKPLQRLTPIVARLAQLFRDRDMTLAEINPLAELERRQLRRARRPHGDGGGGQAAPEARCWPSSASRRTTTARATSRPTFEVARGRRRRRRPPRRDPGQGQRLPRQHRPGDRRGRRLAHAHRRRALPGRQAGQLRRDRRQPLGRQGLRAGQGGAARRTASRRSR